MSDPFDFQLTPLEQLQRHDNPYWRSPSGVVHADRCQWCFSICEGWQGFNQLEAALGKYGKYCYECLPSEPGFLTNPFQKTEIKTIHGRFRSSKQP